MWTVSYVRCRFSCCFDVGSKAFTYGMQVAMLLQFAIARQVAVTMQVAVAIQVAIGKQFAIARKVVVALQIAIAKLFAIARHGCHGCSGLQHWLS